MSLFDSIAGDAGKPIATSVVYRQPETRVRPTFGGPKVLTSQWTGLNPALIARFYPVRRMADGSGWERSTGKREISGADKFTVDDDYEVWCPITDGSSEMTLSWHSPFENTGADTKAPALSAMLQSGSLNSTLQAVAERILSERTAGGVSSTLTALQGRTGITKLNSTQVFSGMPPVKFQMTLHFRALIDPVAEVQAPVAKLKEWALPQYLANDGFIGNAVKNGAKGGLVETIFPSVVPQIIGMKYGDMTLLPLVIEGFSEPITAPRSSDGVILAQSIQVTLGTLTALDRRDVQRIYGG